jgi:PAS domain S-box-containing protein
MVGMWQRIFNKSGSDHDHSSNIVDTIKLDESLHLLRSTTMEVSEAAVSAARALEEQLHSSEVRFMSVIDDITDLVIIKDGEGRWKTVNKLGQEVYDWSHGEYFNKTDAQLAKEYPTFANTLARCSNSDEITWDLGRSYRTEEEVPNGSSSYVFDVIKTPIFEEDGSRKEIIIIGRDVTDSRERHRRTKACFTALNSASDIIFILDKSARIFFCNDRFVDEFHVGTYEDVVNRKIKDVLRDIQNYDEMWDTVSNNEVWEGLCCDRFKLTVLPMMNGAPQPIYYICTLKKMMDDKYSIQGE